MHPHGATDIIGVPHRIGYFEAAYDYMLQHDDVWFATADEIYDWYMGD